MIREEVGTNCRRYFVVPEARSSGLISHESIQTFLKPPTGELHLVRQAGAYPRPGPKELCFQLQHNETDTAIRLLCRRSVYLIWRRTGALRLLERPDRLYSNFRLFEDSFSSSKRLTINRRRLRKKRPIRDPIQGICLKTCNGLLRRCR